MNIREMKSDDMGSVIALWAACGLTRPWNDPRADLERAIEAADAVILVGETKGRLAATAMAGFDGHRGWVYYLAVEPKLQRQGLGRRMFQAAESWLRERGAPKVQLMVREGNDEAVAFYRSIGLEVQPVVTLGRFFQA